MTPPPMQSDEDDFLETKTKTSPQSPSSAVPTTSAAPTHVRKLTKKRRAAIANGEPLGPDRKNGENNFKGVRKEIMDAHLSKYPRNGTRHPHTHRSELNAAFDARVPWRLAWNEEPPSDAEQLAYPMRPAEAGEEGLKAERLKFNYNKLRNFYDRQGASTGGTKAIFKRLAQQLVVPNVKPPHRRADYQHYARMPDYRERVQKEFDKKHPNPSVLGKGRLNAFMEVARELLQKEDVEVQKLVAADLDAEHTKALGVYKARMSAKGTATSDLTEEDRDHVRGRFDEAVVPMLDELGAISGYNLALHAARIGQKDGKPKMDMRSLYSGLGPGAATYMNFKVGDPQRSSQMAQNWGRHVYSIYDKENGLQTRTEPLSTTTPEPLFPESTTIPSRARPSRQATRSQTTSTRGAGPSRQGAARDEDEDDDEEDTAHVPAEARRRAILGAVELQHLPGNCRNPVLIGWSQLEDVLMALRGVDPNLLELSKHISFPRHQPIIGVEHDDDPPAICLAKYLNEVGPLVRAWICSPDLDVHARRAFVNRTRTMNAEQLAEEETKLEDATSWKALKRKAKGAGEGKGRKKRRVVDSSEDEDAADKRGGPIKKAKKTHQKSMPQKEVVAGARPRPRPKPKKIAPVVKPPMQVENTQAVDDPTLMLEDAADIDLQPEHETLEAWVRHNPNLVDEAALLEAKLEEMNDEPDDDVLGFVMDSINQGEQGEWDEVVDMGMAEKVDELDDSKGMADEMKADEMKSEPDEDEDASARPKRAAKARAATEVSQLYEKYPAHAPTQKKTAVTAKTMEPTGIPRTHDGLLEQGFVTEYKHVKNVEWATEGKTWLLGLEGGGPQWESLIKKWYEFEESFDFREPDCTRPTFIWPTEKRPAAVGIWISVARPLRLIPCIKKLETAEEIDEFGTSVRAWWKAVNPKWRRKDKFVKTGQHKDWFSVFWPGPNGFFAILACLWWWGTKMDGAPKDTGRWLRLVQDVEWVIRQMMRNVVARMEIE
uniref:Uncharacterized protein n=1 Tax=Mycena chlorophos TaxID=658473 RepID=A0ABQ0L059_MYCCL|nr:predicted protein [Mycena chlorophos]